MNITSLSSFLLEIIVKKMKIMFDLCGEMVRQDTKDVWYYWKFVDIFEIVSGFVLKVRSVAASLYAQILLGRVSIWYSCRFSMSLCVAGGVRLASCNLGWLHKRWCFSLVPDPISCASWWVIFSSGKRCDLCSQDTPLCVLLCCCVVSHHETRASFLRGAGGPVTRKTCEHKPVSKLDCCLSAFLNASAVTTQGT